MLNAAIQLFALAFTVGGTVCLYVSAPRQQWLDRPWPARPARAGGTVLLLLGWLLWCAVQHPATAVFTTLTLAMLLFIVLPFSAALSALQRRP